jgi:N-acetyl-anhydromuramyl-L-alanine amidase AmpD
MIPHYHAICNQECIGILLLNGDFSEGREPTEAQIITARRFVQWIKLQLVGVSILPPLPVVVGHKEIALPSSPTTCPGSTWDNWREKIA